MAAIAIAVAAIAMDSSGQVFQARLELVTFGTHEWHKEILKGSVNSVRPD